MITEKDIGRRVRIVKALGELRGRERGSYYYGGNIQEVRIGSKADIIEIPIVTGEKVLLQTDLDKRWYVHSDEIKYDNGELPNNEKKVVELISQKDPSEIDPRNRFSKLESADDDIDCTGNLKRAIRAVYRFFGEDDPKEEDRKSNNGHFEPKINPREEFVLWIGEQFPELGKYARNNSEDDALERRRQEVYEAAKIAHEHNSRGTIQCARSRVQDAWDKFDNHFTDSSGAHITSSLFNFVNSIKNISVSLGGDEYHTRVGRKL